MGWLLQLRGNQKLLEFRIPGDAQDTGLAADLAVFDVLLAASSGGINRGLIPHAAACALETGSHISFRQFMRSGAGRNRGNLET